MKEFREDFSYPDMLNRQDYSIMFTKFISDKYFEESYKHISLMFNIYSHDNNFHLKEGDIDLHALIDEYKAAKLDYIQTYLASRTTRNYETLQHTKTRFEKIQEKARNAITPSSSSRFLIEFDDTQVKYFKEFDLENQVITHVVQDLFNNDFGFFHLPRFQIDIEKEEGGKYFVSAVAINKKTPKALFKLIKDDFLKKE